MEAKMFICSEEGLLMSKDRITWLPIGTEMLSSNISEHTIMAEPPVQVKGTTITVSPNRMDIHKPYPFWWEGRFLIAVKRSEAQVEFYAIPGPGHGDNGFND